MAMAPEGSHEVSKLDRLIRVCRAGCKEGLEHVLREEGTDIETLLNQRNKEGTTPLHEACCHGNVDCIHILLKHGACGNMLDVRGFSPIHSAAYNSHKEAIKLLLDRKSCEVDCLSRYNETPLHIASLRGNLDVAKYLVSRGADIGARDDNQNTVLHYASSSNSATLMQWLLDRAEVKELVNEKNKYGRTPAHRAAALGCPVSVSALLLHEADFRAKDNSAHSALEVAKLLNNTRCYRIAMREESPHPFPPPLREREGPHPFSQSSDNLLSTSPQPQRSHSSAGSSGSIADSGSPKPLRRRPSITGSSRPVLLTFPKRVPSIKRSPSIKRVPSIRHSSGEEASIYLSRKTVTRLSQDLEHQDSLSWDMVYDNTAYEPPPDIMFVLPTTKDTLTPNNRRVFSESHELKLRVSKDYWIKDKEEKVDVNLCAAMHLNRSFPQGYAIVSPVCFVSLKSQRPCEINLSIPHAIANAEAWKDKICILSTVTVDPNLKPESPLFSPSERTLIQLQGIELQAETRSIKFRTSLAHPSLFVVAVRDSASKPLPLRCSLFVAYPELDRNSSVSAFDIETYIGMNLKTVTTAVKKQTTEKGYQFEEKHFTFTSSQLQVKGSLTNPRTDWEIEPRGSGEVKYTQVALTQDTDSDSYSHLPAYPPRERFFIEPKTAAGAVKCRITIADSQQELCSILVVPYAPRKDPTPERTPPPSHNSSQSQLPISNGNLGTMV